MWGEHACTAIMAWQCTDLEQLHGTQHTMAPRGVAAPQPTPACLLLQLLMHTSVKYLTPEDCPRRGATDVICAGELWELVGMRPLLQVVETAAVGAAN